LANEEKCLMIEILEQALAVWEIQRQKDLVKKKDQGKYCASGFTRGNTNRKN
jgi:hypothetical protein